MYVSSDPRSSMTRQAAEKKPNAPVAPASYFIFDDALPSDKETGIRSWYARAQNFVVVYSETEAGARLDRKEQPDEYMILLPNRETRLKIKWQGEETTVDGFGVTFVPGGDSELTVEAGGPVIRFFTTRAKDIIARCNELLPEHVPDENVPEMQPWPDPADGFKVRTYSLNVAQEEGRFGRIFRSTNFMINFVYPRTGPRDRTALSPHKHDDFQQCSLCLEGSYIHHIRWPWDTNADLWRDDDHVTCGAPSVTIIPAQALHTSEAVGEKLNQLVDIFCPPRADFSAQPGWVLNQDDYPAPQEDQ